MGLIHKQRDGLPYLLSYIRSRIEKNQNFLCAITGPTGSGKTYSALSIAERLDEEFNEDRIVFTPEAFMELLNSGTLKQGSVIVFDEAGVSLNSRAWQSIANRVINYVLQTFRHKNYIVIFTAPHLAFIDSASRKLFHCHMETVSINYDEKYCKLKPLFVQVNQRTGDAYYKYLRVLTPDGVRKIERYRARMPSKPLVKAYERQKTDFTTQLNEDIMTELDNKGTKNAPTPRQQEVLDLLPTMNIYGVARKLGITYSSANQSVHLLRKKGYVFKPVKDLEDGNKVLYYEVEHESKA